MRHPPITIAALCKAWILRQRHKLDTVVSTSAINRKTGRARRLPTPFQWVSSLIEECEVLAPIPLEPVYQLTQVSMANSCRRKRSSLAYDHLILVTPAHAPSLIAAHRLTCLLKTRPPLNHGSIIRLPLYGAPIMP